MILGQALVQEEIEVSSSLWTPCPESTIRAIFQTIVETIDSNHLELKVISLNEEDFDRSFATAIENG